MQYWKILEKNCQVIVKLKTVVEFCFISFLTNQKAVALLIEFVT